MLQIVLYFVMVFGLWLFMWAAWGGSIDFSQVSGVDAGLGLNPPALLHSASPR